MKLFNTARARDRLRQPLVRVAVILLLVPFLLVVLTPALGNRAYAATPPHPKDQASLYVLLRFLQRCAEDPGFSQNSEVLRDGGKLIFDRADVSEQFVQTDLLGTPQEGGLNSLTCNSDKFADAEAALEGFGIDVVDLFTDETGIYAFNASSGRFEFQLPGGSRSRLINEAKTKLREAFERKFPEINFQSDVMTSAMQYFALLAALDAQCNLQESSTAGSVELTRVNEITGQIEGPTSYTFGSNDVRVGPGISGASQRTDGRTLVFVLGNDSCAALIQRLNTVSLAEAASQAVIAAGGAPTTTGGPGSTLSEPTCESGGDTAWLFCAVVRFASGALEWIDEKLYEMLAIDPSFYNNDGMRKASGVLRNLAYLILVPMVLVMVISTALGFEFVSAYTVKKALPRLVIATMFIALSYDICVFLIDFVQTIGAGIHGLLITPFRGVFTPDLTPDSTLVDILPKPEGVSGALGSVLIGWAAYSGIGAVVGGGLLATLAGFIGIAALTLLGVYVLLLLRHTLIIALLLLAPLAILAWIFPGRDKLWGLWSKTFMLMLWFYPLIMMTTAIGKIMAALLANS